MAVNRKIHSIMLQASGDLSTNQYRAVFVDDAGRVAVSTAGNGTATPHLGILLNKPGGIDRGAEVAISGSIVKMEAGAAINERDFVIATVGGRGSPQAAVGTAYVVGQAITPAGGSAVLFEVQVNPFYYSHV